MPKPRMRRVNWSMTKRSALHNRLCYVRETCATDLEAKLRDSQDYFNSYRAHAGLGGWITYRMKTVWRTARVFRPYYVGPSISCINLHQCWKTADLPTASDALE